MLYWRLVLQEGEFNRPEHQSKYDHQVKRGRIRKIELLQRKLNWLVSYLYYPSERQLLPPLLQEKTR